LLGVARPLREEVEGGVYHVYARGNNRGLIFGDDDDRFLYLALLGGVTLAQRWHCLAYCLMPNHVHLLVELRECNLGRGMQRLHGAYAREFNDRHGRSGHVFQGRYGSESVRDDGQFLTVVRYIAMNPVEAALCARPEDWRWGSYGTVVDQAAPGWLDTNRLLEYFAAWGGADASRAHAEFVKDG
jgi:REP element-mobilizing transposase RayT